MDRAPLRPVPGRPTGPVPDAVAVRRVAAVLPAAAEREQAALGLVVLAGLPRAEVATRLGLDAEEVALALSHARKKLRRTVRALPGSGWCERAERLVSDRLDGALSELSEQRLDVHLRNCPRCVEHERRLVQATDALVAGVAPVPERPELAPAGQPQASKPVDAPSVLQPDGAAPAPPLRGRAIALSWWVLFALAILVAVALVAIAVAAALGANIG